MSATTDALDFLVLILVAFVPALIYLTWIRRTERYQREAWGPILGAFVYGAVFATLVAAILEGIIVGLGTAVSQRYPGPEFLFLNANSPIGVFFLVLVVAPFIEEALKGSGVVANRNRLRLLADGPVFGASVGLGFGFFETFLYGLGAWLAGGLAAGIALILVRSVSSVVLHASSTGMFGYGYARSKLGVPGAGSGSYYLLAVGMHASFNFLASGSVVARLFGYPQYASDAAIVGLILAIFFAFGAIEHVRSLVRYNDYPALQTGSRPYSPPARTRRPPPGSST